MECMYTWKRQDIVEKGLGSSQQPCNRDEVRLKVQNCISRKLKSRSLCPIGDMNDALQR